MTARAEAAMDVDADGELPTAPPVASSDGRSSEKEWILVDDAEKTGTSGLDPDAELDLCFICDCTGSMGQYIKAAQDNIQSIVAKISQKHGAKVQFGLICYRDHPPQDKTYVTKCHPFTTDLAQMSQYVDSMKASGGGDGPEAVTAGLYDALHLPWRPNSTKICVLIADAPPHGLEPAGDGFPNGDPDGRDPLDILRSMAAHGITAYSVGCEPALGSYAHARDFLCTVAEITGGQAVALSSAALLADVIINGSVEELALAKLQRKVEEEVLKVQVQARSAGREISTEEASTRACENLRAGGMRSVQMETDGHMKHANRACWGLDAEKRSLAHVKEALGREALGREVSPHKGYAMGRKLGLSGTATTAPAPRGWGRGPAMAMCPSAMPAFSAPAAAPASTSNVLKEDLISSAQVSRMVQKAKCQSRLA
ncbi:vwkA [Symbiodinium microadriaticum]|nr:vwkA [Symbiodinium microadriaticum]